MPFLLPHIAMSLLAGAVAIAGLNLAFPAEIARSVTNMPFAALLANLPGTAGATRGLPILTICRIEWALARRALREAAAAGRGIYEVKSTQPIFSRMKAMPSAANAARSLLSLP
jgi:hypothetical protein